MNPTEHRAQLLSRARSLGASAQHNDEVPVHRRRRRAAVSSYFGELTFSLKQMRERLPGETYEQILGTLRTGKTLPREAANAVAAIVKDWAVQQGVTHYCHWFQPMTGSTAEKHDAFITIQNSFHSELTVLERFSGNQLIQGEPDASSLPSGGSRSTFEARGYTAWDIESPIFIMEGEVGKTLCIPTVYFSYSGDALDYKTPLLRSLKTLSASACNFLKKLGDLDVKKVNVTLGVEQEYFLIDAGFASQRPDMLLTGRTLLGANPSKGQQLEDHYFGAVPNRVKAFWEDAEHELYRLGIPVKTRHNEVAPSQYEMAPLFEEANIAADHNALTMEVLKNVAKRHGFVCLFHEKPFKGLNGSGKHCNWSLCNDKGENLLEPGNTPHQNLRFLAMVAAVVAAVHRHGDMLRTSIAYYGNDFRLGANEAPPAVLSVFLGEFIEEIFDKIKSKTKNDGLNNGPQSIDLGLGHLPQIRKDTSDRNRTSPFAFTGNKFEFRAPGASQSVSMPTAVLNAAVTEVFDHASNRLDELFAKGMERDVAVIQLISELYEQSKAVLFSGNNYSDEWLMEAGRRNLPHYKTSSAAFEVLRNNERVRFMIQSGVLSATEIDARYNMQIERYNTTMAIDTRMLIEMALQYAKPAAEQQLARSQVLLSQTRSKNLESSLTGYVGSVEDALDRLLTEVDTLRGLLTEAEAIEDLAKRSEFLDNKVMPHIGLLRDSCDFIEEHVSDEFWPIPRYREMLFPHIYTY